jgi:hypothetical protein
LEECEEMASSKNRWLFCCKDWISDSEIKCVT